MDYFENIVMKLLEKQGYWVRQSVKIGLTKEEKRIIDRPTMPRPEIDIVGYNARANELLLIEVKSFLDSPGVRYSDLIEQHATPQGRYKLFTCEKYRDIVVTKLVSELAESGLVVGEPMIKFGLAAGNIYSNDESKIRDYFAERNWTLLKPKDIAAGIIALSSGAYENDPYVIAAKIVVRNKEA